MLKIRFAVMAGLLTVQAVGSVYGQHRDLKTTISFNFVAGNKSLPAGEYVFTPGPGGKSLSITGSNGGATQTLVITRLAAGMHTSPKDAHLVFDKVGNTSFLSEVWIPGDDGYLLRSTKGKHQHQIVNVPE